MARRIAGAVEVGGAGERQVLDIGAERIGDRGQHRVGALAGVLDHHVADIVDHVGVVAEPARHGVGAGAAVEDVVAGVAGEAVGQGIAGAVEVGGAGERQVLEVGAERIGDRGQHRVGAFAGVLDHHVADIVDHVGVVAEPARHGVGAGAAVEDVVAGIAGEAVGQAYCRCR